MTSPTINQFIKALVEATNQSNEATLPINQSNGDAACQSELIVNISAERFQVSHGRNHPITLAHMRSLARTRVMQGKLMEAEKMQIEILEGMTSILGEEHLETLGAMADLSETLLCQQRWKEAGDLATKSITVYLRTVGERHPNILHAMANVACAIRGLGQNQRAVGLTRQVAIASSEVSGDDLSETVYYRETAARWSGVDGKSGHVQKGS